MWNLHCRSALPIPAFLIVLYVLGFGSERLWAASQGVNPLPEHTMDRLYESSDQPVMLVELYTSQGCYSCPPAERWMNRMTSATHLWKVLIPINLHVDYWDYIGWRDPFAKKAFSQRQRKYERFGHTHNVATPGFVLNGKGWNGWFSKQDLPEPQNAFHGKLLVRLNASQLATRYQPENSQLQRVNVHVALLGFGIQTDIPRGENAGKTLEHDFVVVGYQRGRMQSDVTGESKQQLWSTSLPLPGAVAVPMDRQALVIWVTQQDDPAPLQVAAGWL